MGHTSLPLQDFAICEMSTRQVIGHKHMYVHTVNDYISELTRTLRDTGKNRDYQGAYPSLELQ